jgi:hypothetical protein
MLVLAKFSFFKEYEHDPTRYVLQIPPLLVTWYAAIL